VAQFFFLGCVAQDDARLKKVAEIDSLKVSVASLEQRVKAAEEQGALLQGQVFTLQLQTEPYKTAAFDPASPPEYHRIDTTGGTFLVSVRSVTPYLDGFRVTCNFGNPSSATFHGFKLKAKWGPRFDVVQAKKMTYEQWQTAMREKEISLTETLQPGSWNPRSFVLSPAKAEEIDTISLIK
jgi:hypothetical protein